jgi:putative intracellular protease/amidase
MKALSKALIAATAVVAVVVIAGCATGGGAGSAAERPVLMIPWEGSESLEVAVANEAGVMIDMLQSAGYRVVVATKSGTPLVAKTRTITPDLRIAEVHPADYAGLIMPCMNAGSDRSDEETFTVLKAMAKRRRPIAAQRGAVYLLGNAGLLDGRSYSGANPFYPTRNAHFVANRVVVDRNFITSGGCPYSRKYEGTIDGTRELTENFIAQLKG